MTQSIKELSSSQKGLITKEIIKYEKFCRSIPSLVKTNFWRENKLHAELGDVIKALAKANLWREAVLLRKYTHEDEETNFFTSINSSGDYRNDPEINKILYIYNDYEFESDEWVKRLENVFNWSARRFNIFEVMAFLSKIERGALWDTFLPACKIMLEKAIEDQLKYDEYDLRQEAFVAAEEALMNSSDSSLFNCASPVAIRKLFSIFKGR